MRLPGRRWASSQRGGATDPGFTPTQDEVDEAHLVLDHYRNLEVSGETWAEIDGKIIDRYEAARARDLLDWADACARRDREKAEAVARVEQTVK